MDEYETKQIHEFIDAPKGNLRTQVFHRSASGKEN
jgi:hypothetical protein